MPAIHCGFGKQHSINHDALFFMQAVKQQLSALGRNVRLMAMVVLPLARVSQESLTAVYARTFEKAAFGFAKVSREWLPQQQQQQQQQQRQLTCW